MTRWTARRKAELLAQIDSGEVTPEAALIEHALSPEELATWRRKFRQGGAKALRVGVIQSPR